MSRAAGGRDRGSSGALEREPASAAPEGPWRDRPQLDGVTGRFFDRTGEAKPDVS
jgi:hypothetical protein